jgi:ABC-type uncharacterized transport system permease subunit
MVFLLPVEAAARGGRGGNGDGKLMLGLLAIVVIGWLISLPSAETKRAILGFILIAIVASGIWQIIAAVLK